MKILGVDYTLVYAYNDYDKTSTLINEEEQFYIENTNLGKDSLKKTLDDEVLKRKDNFLSYDITLEKKNNEYFVKKINKSENYTVNNNQSIQYNNVFENVICPLNCKYQISAGFDIINNHSGIDYKANEGEKILAAMDGKIVFSEYSGGYGYLIIIEHENGVQTYYANCSKLLKQKGEIVSIGDEIAEVGSTGNSTGNHLHFEIRINGEPVDPKVYLP